MQVRLARVVSHHRLAISGLDVFCVAGRPEGFRASRLASGAGSGLGNGMRPADCKAGSATPLWLLEGGV